MQMRVVLNWCVIFSIPKVWFIKLDLLESITGILLLVIKLKIPWQLGEVQELQNM